METGIETFDETYEIKKDGKLRDNWDIVRKHDLGRQQAYIRNYITVRLESSQIVDLDVLLVENSCYLM